MLPAINENPYGYCIQHGEDPEEHGLQKQRDELYEGFLDNSAIQNRSEGITTHQSFWQRKCGTGITVRHGSRHRAPKGRVEEVQ